MKGWIFDFLMNEAGGEGGAGASFGDAPPATPAAPEVPAGPTYQFPETLGQEFRNAKTFEKFANEDGSFDYGKVMQSYAQLERHLGANRIPVPNENFTDDDWRGVFQKLGLPESADKYSLKSNLPEGYTPDTNLLTKFQEVAHKAGVLPKQAQQLLDFYNNYSVEALTEMANKSKSAEETNLSGLKKEWGDSYNSKVERANSALHQFASQEEIAAMKEAGMLNSTFLRVFDKIASGLSEDSFTPEGKGSFGMTLDDLQEKVRSFYDPSHPFMQKTHPQYGHYQNEMLKMLDKLAKARNN